ncbi:MAG: hypothetical protein ACI9KS_001703 [Sulfitobacter sp.]|jgi:hypothetical protein
MHDWPLVRRDDGAIVENDLVRVGFVRSGQMRTLFDKAALGDVFAPGKTGNQLIAFEDRLMVRDAWDIDTYDKDRAEQPIKAARFELFGHKCSDLRERDYDYGKDLNLPVICSAVEGGVHRQTTLRQLLAFHPRRVAGQSQHSARINGAQDPGRANEVTLAPNPYETVTTRVIAKDA